MKILTIIVSYNFEPWIDKCLGSLRESTMPTDVMVIDNASADATADRIRAAYPEVQLVCSDKNLGFGRANNIGLKAAIDGGYDAAFLLNQDAWVAPDAIGLMAAQMRQAIADGFGIISPAHMAGNGVDLDFGFATYAGLNAPGDLPRAPLVEVPFVNAAFWLLPRLTLERVGGFSPVFYHYGEDTDYANRLRRQGLGMCYVPEALCYHDRQNRPATRQGWLRSEKVWLLAEYANPNYSLPKAFARGVLAGVKKAFADRALWRITAEVLMQSPQIVKCRRQSSAPFAFL